MGKGSTSVYRVSIRHDEKVLEVDSDGYATVWMDLMPLNCILKKNFKIVKMINCYVYFTQLKKKLKKKVRKLRDAKGTTKENPIKLGFH